VVPRGGLKMVDEMFVSRDKQTVVYPNLF